MYNLNNTCTCMGCGQFLCALTKKQMLKSKGFQRPKLKFAPLKIYGKSKACNFTLVSRCKYNLLLFFSLLLVCDEYLSAVEGSFPAALRRLISAFSFFLLLLLLLLTTSATHIQVNLLTGVLTQEVATLKRQVPT